MARTPHFSMSTGGSLYTDTDLDQEKYVMYAEAQDNGSPTRTSE